MPVFNNILYEVTQPIEQGWVSLFQENLSLKRENTTSSYLNDKFTIKVYESPIYLMFNKHIPPILLQGMKIMEDIMMIVMYSNLIEGCIYAYTINLYRRYNPYAYP